MSDDANKSVAALETARKEFRLALAGSSWVKQEDVARAAVAKATSKHAVFKDRIQDRKKRKLDDPMALVPLHDAVAVVPFAVDAAAAAPEVHLHDAAVAVPVAVDAAAAPAASSSSEIRVVARGDDVTG